jgi:hypothetical protein
MASNKDRIIGKLPLHWETMLKVIHLEIPGMIGGNTPKKVRTPSSSQKTPRAFVEVDLWKFGTDHGSTGIPQAIPWVFLPAIARQSQGVAMVFPRDQGDDRPKYLNYP